MTKSKTMADNLRLELTLPKGRMEKLRRDTGADSFSEVISNALRLYEACAKEMGNGAKVVIRRADGTEIEAF